MKEEDYDIEKEYVKYPEAFELKALGFDEMCSAHFINEHKNNLIVKPAVLRSSTMLYYKQNNINPGNQYPERCTAPLWQQAFRWFRKEHSLYHNIWNYTHSEPTDKIPCGFTFSIDDNWLCIVGKNPETGLFEKYYDSHEEAESACLKKLIELVKANV